MKKEWQRKKLGDLCDVLDHKRKPITKRDRVAGEYPYYGATGVLDHVEGYLFDEPIVLVGEDGAKWESGENTAFTVKGKCWVNNHAHVLRPHRTELLDNWLIYHLHHSDLSEFVSGLTVPKLNQVSLREIPIPVPPLPEQQRIVGILDEAFDGIATAKANTEKNLQNARALFESHIGDVFTRRNAGWTVCLLADCLRLITYGFTNPMPTTHTGPYMVTAKNVTGGQIDYVAARHTSEEAFDKLLTDKSRPRVGDVLLTKDGTLGRLAVVEKADLCINQSVALLRPNGRMEPHFMRYLLSSRSYQHRMIGDADGTTIKHIYITRVNKMDVAFPSLDGQRRIVSNLDSFSMTSQQLVRVYSQKLAAPPREPVSAAPSLQRQSVNRP